MKNRPEISASEAAIELGIRLDVLYPLLRVGRLRARKKDGRWFVSADAVARRAHDHSGRTPKNQRLKAGKVCDARRSDERPREIPVAGSARSDFRPDTLVNDFGLQATAVSPNAKRKAKRSLP